MDTPTIEKKKRGRKKKSETITTPATSSNQNITVIIEETIEGNSQLVAQDAPNAAKKRGRKPKGGKLILKQPEKYDADAPIANIVLHLKCSLQDLNEYNTQLSKIVTDPLTYNPVVPPTIMTYNSNNDNTFASYEQLKEASEGGENVAYNDFEFAKKSGGAICQSCNLKITGCEQASAENETDHVNVVDDDINIKDVNQKLKKIKLQLYKNTNPDKKAACFWCTYDYDNQPCYIPKYEMDGQLYGYGSFCRPECAVAYLMREYLDDSTKFERYHLLNQMYSKIYNYKKNIKPAPNPHFLLDKFYGNLTIQEYRKLLKSEHMLLVVEKPMTRILPELHEDNEDFIMNIYGTKTAGEGKSAAGQTSGVYKVKRQSEKQKGPSKTTIMKESFGLV